MRTDIIHFGSTSPRHPGPVPELVSPPRAIVESGSVDVVVQDSHYNLWGRR
ncbi:hypothetical protein [Streptomyces sp. Ag109_O5-1]|uniref:hypothetical protein n=1 Tax=Streptomyces sp. Ag109_O5-1 TaxID=1938851 RepID=UPI00162993FA|nr:hypothetical protein [Streptomyces sp. Ag109_O5-1]